MFTLNAFRHLKRSPSSAAAAVLTIAVTLGAGGTVFALFDAVVLTPPPFADPDSLVMLGELPADVGSGPPRAVAFRTFLEWQARRDGLARIEAYDPTNVTLSGSGPARRISATTATSGFLDMLVCSHTTSCGGCRSWRCGWRSAPRRTICGARSSRTRA